MGLHSVICHPTQVNAPGVASTEKVQLPNRYANKPSGVARQLWKAPTASLSGK